MLFNIFLCCGTACVGGAVNCRRGCEVCGVHQGEGEEEWRVTSERGQRKGRRYNPPDTVAEPKPIWGMLYADDAGIVSRSRNSLAKMMASHRCSVRLVRIDGLGSRNGNHVPDDERYGQGHLLSLLRQPARGTSKPPSLCTLGQLCAGMRTSLSRSTGACCSPANVSDGMARHCTTSPPHLSGSRCGCSKPR